MISAEQVADLQAGDVVELSKADRHDCTVRGRVIRVRDDAFVVGPFTYGQTSNWDLTVVSRAPRPLYVNHPRTKTTAGDVVRDANDDATTDSYVYLTHVPHDAPGWRTQYGRYTDRDKMPTRLRLLVDGTSGQVVLS